MKIKLTNLIAEKRFSKNLKTVSSSHLRKRSIVSLHLRMGMTTTRTHQSTYLIQRVMLKSSVIDLSKLRRSHSRASLTTLIKTLSNLTSFLECLGLQERTKFIILTTSITSLTALIWMMALSQRLIVKATNWLKAACSNSVEGPPWTICQSSIMDAPHSQTMMQWVRTPSAFSLSSHSSSSSSTRIKWTCNNRITPCKVTKDMS